MNVYLKCNFYRCIMNVIIVMGVNVIFAYKVRCKDPMGGQRGFSVSRHNKNSCILKTGQCAQYGVGGGGGVLPKKKDFGKPP